MRVGLPQLLRVLSHELRGPASVLQGYIRLLQRQPGPGESDAAIFAAMQTATGRLSAIGEDASTLAGWLEGADDPPPAPRPVADLLAALRARVPASVVFDTRSCEEALAASGDHSGLVRTRSPELLARALAEVTVAVSRAHDGPVTVSLEAKAATLLVVVSPTAADVEEEGAIRPLSFEAGGLGLGLVLAAHVLDEQQAEVVTRPSGAVEVRLPLARSAA